MYVTGDVITSPQYPANYPDDIDLTWVLWTDPDRKVSVTFSAFSTEAGVDIVRAGDGLVSTNYTGMFFSWSGSVVPPALMSSGHEMWLNFKSDEGFTLSGWSFTATSVPSTSKQLHNIFLRFSLFFSLIN